MVIVTERKDKTANKTINTSTINKPVTINSDTHEALVKKINDSCNKVEELKGQLAAKDKLIAALKSDYAKLNEKFISTNNAAQIEIDKYKAKVDKMSAVYDTLYNNFRELTATKANLEKRVKEAEEKVAKMSVSAPAPAKEDKPKDIKAATKGVVPNKVDKMLRTFLDQFHSEYPNYDVEIIPDETLTEENINSYFDEVIKMAKQMDSMKKSSVNKLKTFDDLINSILS